MDNSAYKVHCGPVGLGLSNIVGIKKQNNIYYYFERYNAIYLHRGRTAIRIACELLGLGHGCEILAPSYNCGSEIDALLSSGSSVVLYKVGKNALIDVDDLSSRISSRTKAIYVTHYFGFTHDLDKIINVCIKNNLYLIEDCALSLFSSYNNNSIGIAGDVAVFSLPKTLPVPDGGILLINKNAKWISRELTQPKLVKILKNIFPLLKSALKRTLIHNISLIELHKVKTNNNGTTCQDMPKVCTRNEMPTSYYYTNDIDNKDMSHFTRYLIKTYDTNEIIEKRRRNYKVLDAIFSRHPYIMPLYKELPDQVCPLFYPIFLENRDAMVQRLSQQQIDARPWWRGFHKALPWDEFPDACYLKNNIIALPVHQDLDTHEMEYIAKSVQLLSSI
jgi:dTDP-4-amino-4,6-dideoxygalactose transaminase